MGRVIGVEFLLKTTLVKKQVKLENIPSDTLNCSHDYTNTLSSKHWESLQLVFSSSLGIPLENIIGHLDLFEGRKLFHYQYLKSINITSKTKTRFSRAFH